MKRWREVRARARARKRRRRYEKKKKRVDVWRSDLAAKKGVSRVSVESEKNVSWVSSAGVNPVDIPGKMGCYMHLA